MNAIYNQIASFYMSLLPELRACVLAWLVSISVTQPMKFLLPLNWHPELRKRLAQAVAFVSAFLTMTFLLPNGLGVILGLVMGSWSPTFYVLAIKLADKYWPWGADFLSADVRGMMTGDVRTAEGTEPRIAPKPPKDGV